LFLILIFLRYDWESPLLIEEKGDLVLHAVTEQEGKFTSEAAPGLAFTVVNKSPWGDTNNLWTIFTRDTCDEPFKTMEKKVELLDTLSALAGNDRLFHFGAPSNRLASEELRDVIAMDNPETQLENIKSLDRGFTAICDACNTRRYIRYQWEHLNIGCTCKARLEGMLELMNLVPAKRPINPVATFLDFVALGQEVAEEVATTPSEIEPPSKRNKTK